MKVNDKINIQIAKSAQTNILFVQEPLVKFL